MFISYCYQQGFYFEKYKRKHFPFLPADLVGVTAIWMQLSPKFPALSVFWQLSFWA